MRTKEPSVFEPRNSRVKAKDEALERNQAFLAAILAIPEGKVSTYGKVAEAAGYPRYHRAVARILGAEGFEDVPWHRVVGADGRIKTTGRSAKEQRARLVREGVTFRGDRVDLKRSGCLGDRFAGPAGQ